MIRAWAKSHRVEAPDMADGLLRLMYDLYDDGWLDSGPNTMTYGVVLDAWSRSGRRDAVVRMESLLREMMDSYIPDQVVPDRVCYQYVLNGWAKHDRTRHGLQKASGILQEMMDLYMHTGDDTVAPNSGNFATVMMAAAHMGDVEMVEDLHKQLRELHRTHRHNRFRSTIGCQQAILLAKAKKGAADEAQELILHCPTRKTTT